MRHAIVSAFASTLLLLELASAGPLLTPRQLQLEKIPAIAEPPYDSGLKPDLVWAAGTNSSSCARSNLRWQISMPTALAGNDIGLRWRLFNSTHNLGEPYNLLSEVLANPLPEYPLKPSYRGVDGNNTIFQYELRGSQYAGSGTLQDPSYDMYGTWSVPKGQTDMYASFSVLVGLANAVALHTEWTWTPPAQCLTRWGNAKYAQTAERDIPSGGVAAPVPSSILALVLLVFVVAVL